MTVEALFTTESGARYRALVGTAAVGIIVREGEPMADRPSEPVWSATGAFPNGRLPVIGQPILFAHAEGTLRSTPIVAMEVLL